MFNRYLVCVMTFAVACSASISVAQEFAGCVTLREYLQARGVSGRTSPEQARALAETWLPRLLSVTNDPSCGIGTASARWHAMSLANQTEQWTIAQELASDGLRLATAQEERALWQLNLSSATYHAINLADTRTIIRAIRELDAFLVLSPSITEASAQSSYPAWLLPSVNALVWKADCQRKLHDYIGAASTEQRVTTVFVAAGARPVERLGGFLPEEALYRAAQDYMQANRPADAAGCLASIRLLPGFIRPAGQHAWNAVAGSRDAMSARRLAQHCLDQLPIDGWSVLQVYHAAALTRVSEVSMADLQEALSLVDRILANGEQPMAAAGLAYEQLRLISPSTPPMADQQAGFHAILLRERTELAMESGDLITARASMNTLEANGWLRDWTQHASSRLVDRERAARSPR